MSWVGVISKLADLAKDGRLPGAARDAVIITVLTVGTNYVGRMDSRFEAIEGAISKMSASVVDLNEAMKVNMETTSWHGKEIQRHSREIERQWEILSRVQEGMRGGGLEIPKKASNVRVPN